MIGIFTLTSYIAFERRVSIDMNSRYLFHKMFSRVFNAVFCQSSDGTYFQGSYSGSPESRQLSSGKQGHITTFPWLLILSIDLCENDVTTNVSIPTLNVPTVNVPVKNQEYVVHQISISVISEFSYFISCCDMRHKTISRNYKTYKVIIFHPLHLHFEGNPKNNSSMWCGLGAMLMGWSSWPHLGTLLWSFFVNGSNGL